MAGESLLSETYLGSTIPQYVLFFAIVCLGAVLGRSLSFIYRRRLKKKAEATETEIDDVIFYALGRPVMLLGVILAIAVGREALSPVEPLESVMDSSIEIPVIIAIAWITIRLTDGIIETYIMEYTDATESKLDDELVPIVSRITNIAIVSIAGVVIMDSIGYDVTAIIASLGVGGIAIAFASRKTMTDVFGGAHILSTKPFVVGDIVDVGGTAGTVKEIGIRTTRIEGFDGRNIVIPNSNISEGEITNITSEPTRRVKTFLGLTYATTPAEMETALELVEETVNGVEGVAAEKTGAWFWEYGDSAMQIRLDYHIEDLSRWKEVRDHVNRTIQTAFEDAGLEMAFPTRTIHLEDGNSC
jgi:MscS family membrane protein